MKPFCILLGAAVAAVVFAALIIRFFNSVPQRATVETISFWLYIAGGVLLAFVPLGGKRQRSRWAKGLLVLSAALITFVGVAELLRHYSIWVLSPIHERAFSNTLEGLRGVFVGVFLSLLFSNELGGRKLPRND